MRSLTPPVIKVDDVIDRLVAGLISDQIKSKLEAARTTLNIREAAFEAECHNRNWWQYPDSDTVVGLSNSEMKALYNDQMSKESGAAFRIYSRIKNSAPYNRCPLCGVGVVSSVDHYLPKYRYSDISITPINLVPSCNDCNKFKHTKYPRSQSDQLIHPYYDSFNSSVWIKATVENQGSPVLLFYVDSAGAFSQNIESRLKAHFKQLRLERLYSSNAAEQLAIERSMIVRSANAGGTLAVKDHLREQAEKYQKISINSWQSAFFNALHESNWFTNGGFQTIPL